MIILPAVLIYCGLLYWLFVQFNVATIWKGDNINFVQTIDKPILNFVKGTLDFFTVFLSLIVVFIVPITLLLTLSQSSTANWGIDINIFAGFSIDLNAINGITSSGLRNPEITGKTEIAIDTSNLTAFYLFMFSQGVTALVSLYGVVKFRELIISLKNGNAFCMENVAILKRIGYLVIIWNIVSPMFQYFAWGAIINDIHFSNEGLRLYPAFDFNVTAIFIGLMMIILSDLFLDATTISQEQRLTI